MVDAQSPGCFCGGGCVACNDVDTILRSLARAPHPAVGLRPVVVGKAEVDPEQLPDKLREMGLVPHPHGPQQDGELAIELAALAASLQDPPPVRSPSGGSLPSEDAVRPNRRLGVNECRAPHHESDNRSVFGSALDVVKDVAAAGGGVIRHVDAVDLTWASRRNVNADSNSNAIGMARIPRPITLYNRLRSHDFEIFADFTLLVVFAAMAGVRVVPTVFTKGGGSRWNDADADLFLEAGQTVLKKNVDLGRPAHEASGLVPSGAGWASFYWDPAETGRGDIPNHGGVSDAEILYQRFALNLYGTSATEAQLNPADLDENDSTLLAAEQARHAETGQYEFPGSAYSKECARRKMLALTAYGKAVGEYLVVVETMLQAVFQLALRDVIPWLELGNELDTQWMNLDTGNTSVQCIAETGTFHACLSAAILMSQPNARFRAGEISSRPKDSESTDQLSWLKRVFRDGLPAELDRWREYNEERAAVERAVARYGEEDDEAVGACFDYHNRTNTYWWWRTCVRAGWLWPRVGTPIDSTELVHQLGLHWYRVFDQDAESNAIELPGESGLATRLEAFAAMVRGLEDHGYNLTWTLSETGFPSEALKDRNVLWNIRAAPRFQAEMLVRLLLTTLASGAHIAGWHPHMSNILGAKGQPTLFSTMGLREDSNIGGEADFLAAEDAWRRPAWYSLRRLAWLVQHSSTITLTASGEIMHVTLVSENGFRVEEARYSTAHVLWLDASASSSGVVVLDVSAGGWTRAAMVPKVTYPSTSVDGGYVSGDEADWQWDGWADGATVADGGATLTVELDFPLGPSEVGVVLLFVR